MPLNYLRLQEQPGLWVSSPFDLLLASASLLYEPALSRTETLLDCE